MLDRGSEIPSQGALARTPKYRTLKFRWLSRTAFFRNSNGKGALGSLKNAETRCFRCTEATGPVERNYALQPSHQVS